MSAHTTSAAESKKRSKSIEIPDLVIENMLLWLWFNYDSESSRLVAQKNRPPKPRCPHVRDLFSCLTVSKQWYPIAARHLWGKYAGYCNLLCLVSTRITNVTPATFVLQSQLEKWKFYSRFISHLTLVKQWETLEDLRIVSELAVLLRRRPLLPNLTVLNINGTWMETPGSHLIVAQLLTGVTPKISITFKGPPNRDFFASCLGAIVTKTESLKDISIYETTVADHLSSSAFRIIAPIVYGSAYPLFSEMVSLERLTLDAIFVTAGMLSVIGDLPRLKQLILGNRRQSPSINSVTLRNLPNLTDKFLSLTSLSVKADVFFLDNLLKHCFSTCICRTLDHFAVITDTLNPSIQGFHFLKLLPRNINSLSFDFIAASSNQIEATMLAGLNRFSSLNELHIFHASHPLIDSANLKGLLLSLPSLRVLTLARSSDTLPNGFYPLTEFPEFMGPGLDLSILSVLATHAPNLEELNLSVLACDTSPFETESMHINEFRKLRTLKFTMSLSNYRRFDFLTHEAALYISALLSPSVQLHIPQLKYNRVKGSELQLQYEKEYNAFTRSFTSRISNYMQVRLNETARIKAGLRTGSY